MSMQLRRTNWRKLGEKTFDVLVVGGGINGAVSAAALSARGARVALVDRGDFASVTSQQSSNLAWGGIKYMESLEFGLVRKLCRARNELLRSYPSSVREIRFFTAHQRGFRHGLWKLVLGSWLYWFIGSFFTRRPRWMSLGRMRREEPVVSLAGSDGGFEYSDAYLPENDARFVFQFVRRAIDHGCIALNYAESLGAQRGADGLWRARVRDVTTGEETEVRARVLVNAAGPYADDHNDQSGVQTEHHHVFSKGIHLIVDQLTPNARVLTFFADDGRLFFAIPMGGRTCIGTTDTRVERPETHVTAEDRRFVLDNINKRLNLARPLTEADIISERCGVRPLVVQGRSSGERDWLQMSRKHVVEADQSAAHVTIFGGKLTDCLNVGEEICDEVERLGVELPDRRRRWYGEPGEAARQEFLQRARHLDLPDPTALRLWQRYGDGAFELLERLRADPSLAAPVVPGAELSLAEVGFMRDRELVVKLDDLLRRRTLLAMVVRRDDLQRAAGLRAACRELFGDDADERFEEYFRTADRPGGTDVPRLAAPASPRV